MAEALLSIRDLKVYYPVRTGFLKLKKKYVKAVDDVSFDVMAGEAFGVVGESGCGKSTTGHAIVGLLKPFGGTISFDGKVISDQKRAKNQAKQTQIIFQDPYSSLDPRFTVGSLIAEPLKVNTRLSKQEILNKVRMLMKDVGLNETQITRYPHEFSGGQRQRIGVARALALEPRLIVCDEPVSALDVSIQAQILNLMQDLQKKYALTYVFISHNLSVVHHLCDRIAVMYLGHLVEIAPKKALFEAPSHPYTRALLKAIPVPDPERVMDPAVLTGDVPSPLNPPSGCCFHTRCPHATAACAQTRPKLREVAPGHYTACIRYEELQAEDA